jgi:hypothetical protein
MQSNKRGWWLAEGSCWRLVACHLPRVLSPELVEGSKDRGVKRSRRVGRWWLTARSWSREKVICHFFHFAFDIRLAKRSFVVHSSSVLRPPSFVLRPPSFVFRLSSSVLRLSSFALLTAASLACNTFYQFTTLPGPEALATDVVGPAATRTSPAPSPTPGPTATAQPTLTAAFEDLAQFEAAMRPEFAPDIEQSPHLTRYTLDVTVTFNTDDSATLTGRERIRYTNQQDFALNELYLMLWPNDKFSDQYLSTMQLTHVTVAGAEVTPKLEKNGLAAQIALPEPLAPGGSVEVSTEFVIQAFPGIKNAARFGLTNDILLAPTFYPLIPRIVDGKWQTLRPSPGGDTTNSDSAFYLWRVTAPADLAIVATGSVVDTAQSGKTQTQTIVTGPMRDLALVVGPLELEQRTLDEITLNAYVLAEHRTSAQSLLDYAEGQVKNLQDEVGPYPFAELDIVDAPGAFGGIEYPGVVFIGVVSEDYFFQRATVHEIGHQWFYSLIGDDQLLEPWLDEAAASYTEVLYDEKVNGPNAAAADLRDFRGYLDYASDPELPIGRPVSSYASGGDYAAIVYGKGALFFDALRQELGDKTFFAFLRNYYTNYRYGFATAADFQATAEETCACDLKALFDLWVYEGGPVPKQ